MSETEAVRKRRVVAVVLPDLLCELGRAAFISPKGAAVRARGAAEPPLGVLLVESPPVANDGGAEESRTPPATAVLAAVNEAARRFGVRAGQTLAEAHAFVARLLVREVSHEQVRARLGEVAEVALGFGPTVAFETPDTVWVEVTGAAHLAGGEERLALELLSRVQALGHRARVAVSEGPRLAQAFARWGRFPPEGVSVLAPGSAAASMAGLPVRALPVDGECASWLVRLGVHSVGDLARLPRAAAASRLGEAAGTVLDLAQGRDASPLVAYVPPPMPKEETTWEDPASGVEPLLFVLRGLVARLGARLEGRGEALQALDLVLLHDAAIARLEGVALTVTLHFEFATPLYRAEELFRVITSRLGRHRLLAPTVGLRLEAKAITRALALQLSLSRYAAGLGGDRTRGPETLPVVLSELVEDLGRDKVGVLEPVSSHRPERKSRLSPVSPALLAGRAVAASDGNRASAVAKSDLAPDRAPPTRLLPRPLPFDAPLRRGATVSLGHRLYTIERIAFEKRLESVEWWTKEPVSRDYLRVWLRGARGDVEAVVYLDRATGVRRVHGICD